MRWLLHSLCRLTAVFTVAGGGLSSTPAAIVQAEYFVGSDPGAGNGTALALAEMGTLAATIQSQAVALAHGPGTYQVGIRVKDDAGRWSNPLLKRFTVHPGNYSLAGGLDRNGPASQGMSAAATGGFAPGVTAEYFVGNDPGPGAGQPVGIASVASLSATLAGASVPQAGLAPGTYPVGLRVRNAAGPWSRPVFRSFTRHPSALIAATEADVAARPPAGAPDAAVTQIWRLGMAHQCPVVTSQVVIGGVTVQLEARQGETQQAFLQRLLLAINGEPRLTPLVTAHAAGANSIELRAVQVGAWPADWLTASAALTVETTRPGNLSSAGRRITQAEYFLDVDPGAGLAVSTPITLQTNDYATALNTLPVNIQTLRAGNHRIGLRFKNAAGRWGQPLFRGLNSFLLFGAPDVTPPVLTLTGGDNLNLLYSQAFTEPGFSATDETDGNLTAAVAVSGQVFPLIPGPHLLRYVVTDKAGNRTERTRTVQVVDANLPVITGSPVLAYDDPPSFLDIFTGLAATDAESGNLTHRLRLASGTVNWFQSGSYPLVFHVTDAGGNVTAFNRTVSLTARATQYPPFPMWMNGYAAGRGTVPEMLVPSADPDADGLSNQEEWNADTNPFDPFSNLELAFASPTSLWWCGRLRINYRLDSSLNLGTWQPLTGALNTDTGEDFEVDFSALPGPANRRFFRLITEPRMSVLVEP